MKVKSESEVAQSCAALQDPMDCSLPGFSTHGTFQVRVLEWGAIASLLTDYDDSHIFITGSRHLYYLSVLILFYIEYQEKI